MTTRQLLTGLCFGWCCLAATAPAEEPDEPVAVFSETDAVDVRISAPWRRLIRQREEEGPYPARIEYTGKDGQRQSVEATVEKRGLTRQRICRVPPIRLRFEKSAVEGTLFEGNHSIKLVTHCARGGRWDRYYRREMLAYRIYNRITELSFRVRPLALTYHDDERDSVDGPHFAFIIEDDKLVGDRHGLDKLEVREISPSRLRSLETSRFALFQYLIGNEDWSALSGPDDECCHNVKLIGEDSLETVYAVPYDFDSSGLVDAHYAFPQQALPITDVTQRLFRGFCVHNDGLEAARREFVDLEDDIRRLVENAPELSERERRRAWRYLSPVFGILHDDRLFESRIIDACRR